MKSQHTFSNVPTQKLPRSSFNLSHSHKTTLDVDYLYPICQPIDIIPGDTFSWKTSFFIRLNTMLRPILDNLWFETFAFFVPYRTLWVNHEKFHGAQDDPGDSIDFTVPVMTAAATTRTQEGSLWDYFGLPITKIPDDLPVSAMPFRAYTKIYNKWFRDENLQVSIQEDTDNGGDALSSTLHILRKRGKRKDYFTSALPWPQKQTLGVTLPLGTTAGIFASPVGAGTLSLLVEDGLGGAIRDLVESTGDLKMASTQADGHVLLADLAGALAPNINEIRLAFQTQRVLEMDARAGTRYVEALKSRWRVTSPDFRLQRPEFLGGGSSPVQINTVSQQSAQTTPAENDKVGNLAANGIISGTHSWSKSFVEHGVVIILGNIRGDISYSQGVDRYWSKATRYDFMYPELAGIGEQSVLNKEIWVTGTGTPATGGLVFGYQERYGEYRFLSSKLTSLMRPDASGTLASWHLSEDFATLPALGASFIEANTGVPLDRAIAVPSEPQFFADFYHEVRAARPLPMYGVPGNMDRF